MVEYGVEDSWTTLYSCGPILGLTIIGMPNDDEVFFMDSNGQLITSNFKDQVFKEFGIHGMRDLESSDICGSQTALRYVENFVALNSMY